MDGIETELHLSAHFQGFCRNLYTECAQIWIAAIPAGLRATAQAQFSARLALEKGNPTYDNIKRDFNRFGLLLNLQAARPAGPQQVTDLGHLNDWRNRAAHQSTQPPGGGVPQHRRSLPSRGGERPATDWRPRSTVSCVPNFSASWDLLPGEFMREDSTMAAPNLTEPLAPGTPVRIRLSGYHRAKVAEFLGPLGPKGARVYRVLVQRKLGAFISRFWKSSLKCWMSDRGALRCSSPKNPPPPFPRRPPRVLHQAAQRRRQRWNMGESGNLPFMNLVKAYNRTGEKKMPSAPATHNGSSYHWLVVHPEPAGQYTARALGIPELSATAPTREQAVEQVRARIGEWLNAGWLELVAVPQSVRSSFSRWIDPADPGEKVYLEELARQRADDLEATLREYAEEDRQCSSSSSIPNT